jgi:transcriptional regulator with XRE-family HTH domain
MSAEVGTASWYIAVMIQHHRLSQKEAAQRLGVSEQYLSDVVNGRRYVTPKLANAAVEKIETRDKLAALRDLHLLGAEQHGWIVRPATPPDGGNRRITVRG